MKVLHIAQMLKGGVGAYLCEILPPQIVRLGAESIVILVAEDQVPFLPPVPRETIRTFDTSKRTPWALIKMAIDARRLMMREKVDIVHLHSTFAGAIVRLALLVPPWRRPKLVYCSHGWAFNMRVSSIRRFLYSAMELLLSPLADRILCISQFELDAAAKRGLSNRRLRLVYNGVARQVPASSATIVEFDDDKLNLLFIGRQDKQKGFPVLAEAMKRLESFPIHLHAIGAPVVKDESVTTDQAPNITQHGWQSRERIPQFISASDAIVVPSLWEGFGLAAIEAMRQGKAVCASAVDALPEVVLDGVSGRLFPPEDPVALAQLLSSLDKAELSRLGANGANIFFDRFTAERMNEEILGIYFELLKLASVEMHERIDVSAPHGQFFNRANRRAD